MNMSVGIVVFAMRAAAFPPITDTSGQVLWIRIIGLCLLVLGVGVLAMGATQFRLGAASEHWATTEGRVTASSVTQQIRGKMGQVYLPAIAYTYSVNGAHFSGKRWAYGRNAYAFKEDAQAIVSRYPVGAEVAVNYAPGRPQWAALEPGVHDPFWPATSVGIGGGVLIASAFFLLDPSGYPGGGQPSGYRSPLDVVALAVVLVATIGVTIWTSRRKGHYNPWTPTIGTGAAMLIALVCIILGRGGPVTAGAVIFAGVVLIAFVGLMYAIFRFGLRVTAQPTAAQPTAPRTTPTQLDHASSTPEHAHSGL